MAGVGWGGGGGGGGSGGWEGELLCVFLNSCLKVVGWVWEERPPENNYALPVDSLF